MEKIFFQNSKEKEFDAINCMHVDVQICLNYDSEKITTDKKLLDIGIVELEK